MKKIRSNILSVNDNQNNLSDLEYDRRFVNTNQDFLESSVVLQSKWIDVLASKPSNVQPSADPETNNVLIAPFYFVLDDVNLDSYNLKNLSFLIQTKENPNITCKGIKLWEATDYDYENTGYKVYTPTKVWDGGIPYGLLTTDDFDTSKFPYYKQAWRCSYKFQGHNRSGNLRSISGSYVYSTNPGQPDNEVHTVTFFMKAFTTVESTQATGIAYVVDYNNTLSDYESYGFNSSYSVVFSEMDRCYGAIGGFDDDLKNVFRLDRLDTLDSGVDFNPSEYSGIQQTFYDSNYFWPIVYRLADNHLVELPNAKDNIYSNPSYVHFDSLHSPAVPFNLYVTVNDGATIESNDRVAQYGTSATGQSFSYVKKSNGKYEFRIVGGLVCETNTASVVEGTLNSKRENYTYDSGEWEYEDTDITDTLEIPKFLPVEQDVSIRCLLVYTPANSYKDAQSK